MTEMEKKDKSLACSQDKFFQPPNQRKYPASQVNSDMQVLPARSLQNYI